MKRIALIVSEQDPAGMNIKRALLSEFSFQERESLFEASPIYTFNGSGTNITLFTTAREAIHCEAIDPEIAADLFVFATKHQSQAAIPSLCVHVPGNWGRAEMGGRDRALCIADASLLRSTLFTLREMARGHDSEVIQECTHHGPYLETPALFIEIGSTEKEWNDPRAAQLIAQAIMAALSRKPEQFTPAIGIGGLHHTPNFTKVMERSGLAFGHICPKYMLESLDKEMLEQAIARSTERPEKIVLDWKGLGEHKQRILAIATECGIPVERTLSF